MNVVWIVAGLCAAAAVVGFIGWAHGRGDDADVGVVSHQWLAEHRHSEVQDSHR